MRCDAMWCGASTAGGCTRSLSYSFPGMCVCVYVHMYFCMYVRRCLCMHTCMDGWTQGRMDEQTDGCVCMRIFICGYCSGCLQASRILAHSTCCMDYVYVLVCMFVCLSVFVRVCLCLRVCSLVCWFVYVVWLFGLLVCLFPSLFPYFFVCLLVCVISTHVFYSGLCHHMPSAHSILSLDYINLYFYLSLWSMALIWNSYATISCQLRHQCPQGSCTLAQAHPRKRCLCTLAH